MGTSTKAGLLVVAILLLGATSSSASTPQLGYGAAKKAVQAKADKFAGAPTRITAMYKRLNGIYSAVAEWKRVNPVGCPGCGYDPATGDFYDEPRTEACSISLIAKRKPSRQIVVRAESFACY